MCIIGAFVAFAGWPIAAALILFVSTLLDWVRSASVVSARLIITDRLLGLASTD
jgi:hypothetical protein